jgi:tyrosine-protein phosphatase SIW14
MSRSSLFLSALVLLLIAGLPFLYADLRHDTYRNFRVVEEGVLYRSGQMSRAGFERVCHEKGIRTVINLRDDRKGDDAHAAAEEQVCAARGIKFHRLEMRRWEEENGQVPMAQTLREFEALIADEELTPRPVLVHCFAGIHRTGAMVAVYRMKYHRWTNAEAVTELQACDKPTTTYFGNLVPFLLRYRPVQVVGD